MITRLKLSTIEQGLPKYRSMLAGNDAYQPTSFDSIATVTLSVDTASITFSSITSSYQHLQIRGLSRNTQSTTGGADLNVQLNSDTGANYVFHQLDGNGSSASAYGQTSMSAMPLGFAVRNGSLADTYSVSIIDIHDYASTTKNKTLRAFSGYDLNGSGNATLFSGLRLNTAAVTSVTLSPGSGSFKAGTTFALYGIKA